MFMGMITNHVAEVRGRIMPQYGVKSYRRGLLRCSFRPEWQCEGLEEWDEQWYRFPRFFILKK